MAEIILTKDNFDSEVMASDKPVFIDFWASWCGPCKMMLPVVGQLADEREDVKICKLNVDDEPDLAYKYGVSTIPTFVLIKDGKEVKRRIGVVAKAELDQFIDQNK